MSTNTVDSQEKQVLRVLVADDERLPRQQLIDSLMQCEPRLEVVAEVANGQLAFDAILALEPDLAFLDIRMPALSGLEVAMRLRELNGDRLKRPPAIVFLTAYDHHALEAFEARAVDYLLKPVDIERLKETLARLAHQKEDGFRAKLDAMDLSKRGSGPLTKRLRWIQASVASTTHFIPVDEVMWFRSDEKYTLVQTPSMQAVIRSSLKELEQQLDPDAFWMIHRNCLVAVSAIERSERDAFGRIRVKIRGSSQWLDVSRSHAHRFKGM
ncbi:MAG: response regulator transcription factor [Betaproteobacteria bacterium]|jgi:DNA-binding LytR/AlgR family response regulator|nr:response regulator transcription factor [Betaproteobacteria bacterium]